MLALIAAAVLAAEEGRNDLKAPVVGPDSVHVGICTGTDIKENEILLLDRLCLNRQSVVQTIAALDMLQKDRDDVLTKLNQVNKELAESKSKEGISPLGVALISTGVAAVVLTAVIGGLKASGKLQ